MRIADLAEAFCDVRSCFAIRVNRALYFDDNHMSAAGAQLAAQVVMRQLGDLRR